MRKIKAQGGAMIAPQAFNRAQAIQQEKARLYAEKGVITTPGYLRLEVALKGATNVIQFQVRDSQGGVQHVTERRLKVSDTFTVLSGAVYIGKALVTGPATTPTEAQFACMEVHTFPNPLVFTGGSAANNLKAMYNGYLSVRVDSTVFIDSMPVLNFYRVATSQQGVLGGTGGVTIQADEWPIGNYGSKEWTPTIELNGLANTEININIPTSVDLSSGAATTYEVNAVLYLQGFLNQGAASVQNDVMRSLKKSIRMGEMDGED